MSGDVKVSLSKLEKRFIERLVEADLALPETNRIATGRRVELDSFRFHNSRHSWEQGQECQREAYARGDDFRRYTCKDVFEDPRRMLPELRELLA